MHKISKVDFVFCGRFHYHKYLSKLVKLNILNKVIYSYKIGFDFGIGKEYQKNIPLKEYMMYLVRYIPSVEVFYSILPMLHRIWQLQVCMLQPKAKILHCLIHGNCYHIIKKYKKNGAIIVGEVVNVHPEYQKILLI